MYRTAALLGASFLAGSTRGQQVGTSTAETHPKLQVSTCTTSGGCTTSQQSIVLDANWRWLHSTSGYTNCYTGNTWDKTLCPSNTACATNCALEGADYPGTYGISTSGNALKLNFVTKSANTNIGSRVYLMAPDDTHYQMFQLLNKEFTFDVDVSNLPCGLNGALYFSHMQADGGLAAYPSNKAGAKYGTGYCDAQCPHDLKFINGQANVDGWAPSTNDANAGSGTYGSCCSEMDIWESNSQATAYTPHPCSVSGQGPYRCSGTECGDGDDRYSSVCDKDGCDFNSWRLGNHTFFGPGLTLDTKSKMTVVTQFITDSGTSSGNLKEIRRLYVQNGKVFQNSNINVAGISAVNSLSDATCAQQKTVFGDQNLFSARGGMAKMGDAYKDGMVLVMSLWDDHAANALWLDSNYPVAADPSSPGVSRGPCSTSSGVPADVEAQSPGASVTYSNIKWGDIGSTYSGTPAGGNSGGGSGPSSSSTRVSTSTRPATSTVTSRTSSATTPATTGAAQYAQCGGQGWSGTTGCASPFTCQVINAYYSQCV